MIAVLTSAFCKSGAEDSMKYVKEAYCRLYGYEFVFSEEVFAPGRKPEWQKIGLILSKLKNFDWVVYLAPNVGFANFSYGLEKVINDYSKGRDIMVCKESPKSVDIDVIFCKNSSRAIDFLSCWAADDMYHKWKDLAGTAFYEVACGEDFSDVVLISNMRRLFNSVSVSNGNYRRRYHVGDFIENCSSREVAFCDSESKRILKLNEPYINGRKPVMRLELKSVFAGDVTRRFVKKSSGVKVDIESNKNNNVSKKEVGKVSQKGLKLYGRFVDENLNLIPDVFLKTSISDWGYDFGKR